MNILYYYHDVCGLGDFYLLFPVFDALRLKHKDDKITLLAREEIIDIASNKKWFDTCLDTGHTNYPINQYDRVYNWDIQKNEYYVFTDAGRMLRPVLVLRKVGPLNSNKLIDSNKLPSAFSKFIGFIL